MPIQTPHFPDLLFDAAERLRRWENATLHLLGGAGYRELHPSLVAREPADQRKVRFFDGEQLVALRWDHTRSLAALLAGRFIEPPPRVSYAGAVFRKPAHPWEPTERFEVGCERVQDEHEATSDADLELARLLLRVPSALGMRGGFLQLGHLSFLSRPLALEGLPSELASKLAIPLSRRAPHRLRAVLLTEGIEGAVAARLLSHFDTILAETTRGVVLDSLRQSPYAPCLNGEIGALSEAAQSLRALLPAEMSLRVDLADVHGLDLYTGPTIRLWAPGGRQELAAGGRYDALYPSLGKPWRAAGFCVRLTPLLDLAETRPDLFGVESWAQQKRAANAQ